MSGFGDLPESSKPCRESPTVRHSICLFKLKIATGFILSNASRGNNVMKSGRRQIEYALASDASISKSRIPMSYFICIESLIYSLGWDEITNLTIQVIERDKTIWTVNLHENSKPIPFKISACWFTAH